MCLALAAAATNLCNKALFIYKYKNIDTLNGTVPENYSTSMQFVREVQLGPFGNAINVAIDSARDRLYYLADGQGVRFVEKASISETPQTTSSSVQYVPSTLLNLSINQAAGYALAYDATADRLYAGSGRQAY